MAADVLIRTARGEEFPQLLALWCEARGTPGKTDDPAGLRALIERDRGSLLVAELNGRIVGSLIAAWDGWRGNMYRLTVHPSCRRRGIARRLVEVGEKRLRSIGARRISALVWEEDEPAMRTWLSAGYKHDKGTERLVKTVAD